MEEVRKSLTESEQALLSDLFENRDVLRALGKALSQRQLELAMSTMADEAEWEQYLQNKGEIRGSKWLMSFLKHNHEKWQKRREKATINQEEIE